MKNDLPKEVIDFESVLFPKLFREMTSDELDKAVWDSLGDEKFYNIFASYVDGSIDEQFVDIIVEIGKKQLQWEIEVSSLPTKHKEIQRKVYHNVKVELV